MTVHKVKAVKGTTLSYTWQGVCTCGWVGPLHGLVKGARARAVNDAREHAHDAEQG